MVWWMNEEDDRRVALFDSGVEEMGHQIQEKKKNNKKTSVAIMMIEKNNNYKSHNKRWRTHKKRKKKPKTKKLLSSLSPVLKHLDRKAVLQTTGYQHTSNVPQCLLLEA